MQYLSELIRRNGYAGIGYPSVMHEGGKNIALFVSLPEFFDIKRIMIARVSKLEYQLDTSKVL